nr:restriction endonuclease subunit S [uncultured Tolumonas sp.]
MTTLTAMPKYEAYKNSGIEWIGEIPDDWGIKKLSHLFLNIGSGTTPATGNISFYDGNISWLQTGDLTDGVINSTSKTISERALKTHSTLKQYKAGSLVVAMYGATIGKVGLLNISTATNQACCVLEKTDSVDMRFAFYLFMGFKSNIVAMGYGGGQPNISQDLIRNLRFPFPNQQLQTVIANFLDEKTAKIDEAIAIKEKQIELLKERKQIIIQQAVTQGLDSTVPMKDSGVEWIGQIPAHWSLKKIKHITKKIGSGITPLGGGSGYLDEGIPLLRSQNIHFDKIDLDGVARISEKTHKSMVNSQVKYGDVLLNITGGSIGRCYYVEIEDELNVNQHVCIVRPTNQVNSVFLNYVLASEVGQGQIWFFQQGGGREGLNFQAIKNFYLALPPEQEQKQITEFITKLMQDLNNSVDVYQQQIDRLKEYKTTLINSAVTGKIKVV